MSTKYLLPFCALLGASLLACGDAADDAPFSNGTFDNWCDAGPCNWVTRQGAIERTKTWHKDDLGVSFVETPTEITQRFTLNATRAPCILFDTIADVAPEARVSMLLDFNDDGIVDVKQTISALRWKSVPFPVRAPVAYDKVRLSVIKEGTGRAVLAQMRVVPQYVCVGEPFTLKGGSVCSQNEVCTSGHCVAGLCDDCAEEACEPTTPLTPARRSE